MIVSGAVIWPSSPPGVQQLRVLAGFAEPMLTVPFFSLGSRIMFFSQMLHHARALFHCDIFPCNRLFPLPLCVSPLLLLV